MPKAPDERIVKAKELYLKGMKLVEIASQLNLPEGTVRRWKSTHKWGCERSGKKSERSHRKRGAPVGNKNATGPPGNKNAEKHGLFSKYLPEEMLDIMNEIDLKSPADIIWESITIQYTAIIRSQRIMYVKGQDDLTKELMKVKTSSSGKDGQNKASELEYELQFAWDKQAGYLQAQSRAMQALNSLIKQFLEMSDPHDERRLKLELMEVELQKRKDEADPENNGDTVDDWIAAVMDTAECEEADAE